MKAMKYSDGLIVFYCPGCEQHHGIDPNQWSFNRDFERPTFSPSLLVRSGHYAQEHNGACWCTYNASHPDNRATFKCGVCHSFVQDGKIQYLNDCTHSLAGQTIDLPDVED